MGVDTLGPLVLWGASGRRGRHGHNPARAVSALESDPTAGGTYRGRASACGVLHVGLSCFLGRLGDGKAPLVQTAEEKAASALRASADAPPPPPPHGLMMR